MIPLAIVAGGIIVAMAVYASMPKTAGNPALVRPVGISDHILGNPAAPVMIIEYSDFDCTYCRGFHDALHQIIANAGTSGRVAWVFRHFPLSEIHPNALSHAKAAECAGEVAGEDGFWKFANALFANQPVDSSRYGELASSIGLSGNAFATCYASVSAALDARITADRQNALDMGAVGTPFSIILANGKDPVVMDVAYPYDIVKQLVDQALGNTP
ncbi:MAG: Sodium/proton antiporter [Parcubacteria group bacterium GW2011_GWB1_57_6]|nr:MAG: Sodium/proton antiporter [Parcubacteria group bacterium GW2011_GWA1_56_13]KKW45430.1 MAG: Sodium/proton antiporter [Parcubacteria group bacterium GW2011_GWB1_57_6]